MTRKALFVILVLLAVESSGCAWACVATPVSKSEALKLVMSVPEAVAYRERGIKVTAVSWVSRHENDLFYSFMLLSSDTKNTLLNNGVIGYFYVNKGSARVVNVAGREVTGKELGELQARYRLKHCIDDALVKKNDAVEP